MKSTLLNPSRFIPMARAALLLAFGASLNAAEVSLKFLPDGSAIAENHLVEVSLNHLTSRFDGIKGWKYKPTGYEMVDVLYRNLDANGGHLAGLLWDSATVGSLPSRAPDVGALFVPVAAGVTKDERAVVVEQRTQGEYRLTRTLILRRDYSAVELRLKLENLEATPTGFALRLHSVMSPGARGQYQSANDLVLLPGEKGILSWPQGLPLDEFKAMKAGFAIRPDYADFPESMWSGRVKEGVPRLKGNWLVQVNPENGDGMAVVVDENAFLGFYNHPATTVEPLLKGVALQKGESWEARLFYGAFSGAKGAGIEDATPLYVALEALVRKDGKLKGVISPLFEGTLAVRPRGGEKGGAEYQAKPLCTLALNADAPEQWELVALDRQGAEIGRIDPGGKVTMAEPVLERERRERPKVTSAVHEDPAGEGKIRAALKARDFVIQCDWNESEAVRALAEKMALRLGVGLAWTPRYSGKMIAFGSATRSATVRNAGLLKQSVDANWPGAGKGAILAYDNFESTTRPLILVAGSDDAGALAAARAFEAKYVEAEPQAEGFRAWASPVSDPGMVWSRPQTGRPLDKIAIRSARNEYDSAQVIITPYQALTDLEVTVDPLIHASSGEPISEKFTGFRKNHGPLRVRWAENYPLHAPEGWPGTPDALLSRPVTSLPAGKSQVLWLTSLVAPDARPGLYKSALHVKAGGRTQTIPIELQVDPFTLPKTGLKGEAYMSMDLLSPRRRLRDPEITRLVTTLVEHRFRVISIKEPGMIRWHFSPEGKFKGIQTDFLSSNEDGTVLMDTSRFDWLQARCEHAAKPYELEYIVALLDVIGWPEDLGAFRKLMPERYADRPARGGHVMQSYWSQEMLEMFRTHLERRGLRDRVEVKVGDEPPGFDFWWENHAQAAVHSGIRFGTAFNSIDWKQAEKSLHGSGLKRYKPLYQQFDPQFARKAQAAGHEVGWYNCGPPPRSSVGASASELRSYYWQAAKYNLDFVSRWGVQCWGSEGTTPENVWTFRYSHHHSLLYPEHPEKPGYNEKGKGWQDVAPLDSIRLELIRDGLEDADYVRELRRLIGEARAAGRADEAARGGAVLDSIWKELYPSLNHYDPPYEEVMKARGRVADAIVELQGTGDQGNPSL